jgi:hypothetical protein
MAYSPNTNIRIEDNSEERSTPERGRSLAPTRADRGILRSRRPQVSIRPISTQIENLELEDVQITENNTIKLDREVFSRSSFNSIVDNSFEELQKKEDTFSITQFFQLYNSLFFDIPKLGNESHIALISKSREYVKGFNISDPKDETINNLNEEIARLERELLLANSSQTEPEHPFFRNGTIVSKKDSDDYYYMDKGFKRKIDYNDNFHQLLLKVLGYTGPEGGDNWYPEASVRILDQIKTGPNLSEGNFEQGSFIKDSELFIGENVTDDTKDAQINNLKKQLRDIKSGDFSNAPELEAFVVDNDEAQIIIGTIGNSIADELNKIYVEEFGSAYIASNGRLVRQNDIKTIFNKILDKVVDKSEAAIQGYIFNSQ